MVSFEWIVGEPQLEIFEEAEFQQAVHVLVAVGNIEPVFNFQRAALHRFPCGREGGPVGHSHEFVLRRWRRLCVKRCRRRETREQGEGQGPRPSGEYSQFVPAGEANTCGRHTRVSCGPFGNRCSCCVPPRAILNLINYSESQDETTLICLHVNYIPAIGCGSHNILDSRDRPSSACEEMLH
jgi:hypothetical protein